MPLSITVGLSRKASRDFQSSGASIHISAELDSALLAKPPQFQEQIAQLYDQARQALEKQMQPPSQPPQPQPNGDATPSPGDNGQARPARMAASQRRAISGIARRLNIDPASEGRKLIGVDGDTLSVRQASQLIDHLQGLETAGNEWESAVDLRTQP
jgi:hypothetical protein